MATIPDELFAQFEKVRQAHWMRNHIDTVAQRVVFECTCGKVWRAADGDIYGDIYGEDLTEDIQRHTAQAFFDAGLLKMPEPVKTTPRWQSRKSAHWLEDLTASIDTVRPLLSGEESDDVQRVLDALAADEIGNPDELLDEVRGAVRPGSLGAILRFHLQAMTSLLSASSRMVQAKSLAQTGLTVADLRWPAAVLSDLFAEQAAPVDPVFETRLAEAISHWETRFGAGEPIAA